MILSLLPSLLFIACADVEDSRLERVDEAVTSAGLYKLSLSPDPDPPTAGPAGLWIVVTDADEQPIEGADITLDPWMPEHGHGASQAPVVSDLGGGDYFAEWTYSMPGYWEITLDVTGPEGADDVVLAYDVL